MDKVVRSQSPERLVWATYAAAALWVLVGLEPIVFTRIAIHDCHNYDLGIYSQAIYLLSWDEPNPWLTVRQTKIFNDHFDPILYVAGPAAKWFDPAITGAAVEAIFVLASGLPMVWLYRRQKVSASVAALAIAYTLTNRGVMSALMFPFHPTTWAILPMAALVAAMLVGQRLGVVVACVLLFCCKEEFPFVGLMVAIYYLTQRDWRLAAVIALGSLAWILGVFWLRPLVLGDVNQHAAQRFVSFARPLAALQLIAAAFFSRPVGHLLLPLAPLGLWMFRRGLRPASTLWLLLLPPLAIRMLGCSWGAHYLAPLAPLIVLSLIPLGSSVRLPPSILAATFAILVALNVGPWQRAVAKLISPGATTRCPRDAARLASIEFCRTYLLDHPQGQALVEGNLIPRLVVRPELYQVAGAHDPAQHVFRYVLVEKPPHGDPWPVSLADYEHRIEVWRRAPGVKILRDDPHVFFATGALRDR